MKDIDDLETIELFIDDEDQSGIEAISLVEFPAIEENFVALSKHKIELKTMDEEKRLVVGLALVPDKKIYRNNGGFEYNITFSKDTVRKAAEKYLKSLKIHNATIEHEMEVDGVYLTESWIVEDVQKDKTALYDLNAPEGAWAVSMRIENDEVWDNVKAGKYLGFSIEGIFNENQGWDEKDLSVMNKINQLLDELESENLSEIDFLELEVKNSLECDKLTLSEQKYSDYPEAAHKNALRALKYKIDNKVNCGTKAGWQFTKMLAKKQPISRCLISQMASYVRFRRDKDVPYSKGCGKLLWDAWGGDAGINWASKKLKEIDKEIKPVDSI